MHIFQKKKNSKVTVENETKKKERKETSLGVKDR